MKEATGEANMTVITIVLIAIVVAVGGPIIKNLVSSTEKSACCESNGGVWSGGKCYETDPTTGQKSSTIMADGTKCK